MYLVDFWGFYNGFDWKNWMLVGRHELIETEGSAIFFFLVNFSPAVNEKFQPLAK